MISSSLIISTYNKPEMLRLVLDRVSRQSVAPDEVIIADDGSGEETRRVVEEFAASVPFPVKHIWHEDKGFRKTIVLNKAIREAAGDYIIQIDGDILIEKHFIADHLRHAERGTFVRGTRGNLSPKATENILKHSRFGYLDRWNAVFANPFNALRLPCGLAAVKKRMDGSKVKGCNMAFWRDDLLKVNGYDNTLQGWGHEDEEIACRLVNAGIAKKVVKLSAVAFHLYHKELARNEEPGQRRHVNEVKANGIIATPNGIKELSSQE